MRACKSRSRGASLGLFGDGRVQTPHHLRRVEISDRRGTGETQQRFCTDGPWRLQEIRTITQSLQHTRAIERSVQLSTCLRPFSSVKVAPANRHTAVAVQIIEAGSCGVVALPQTPLRVCKDH